MKISIDNLGDIAGRHLGYTEYHEITQERVNQFADATGDHQWIHVDPARAAEGPFGGTIAHGYLTLALAPSLFELLEVTGASMAINYGANRLRFPAPVPVGSNVRLGAEITSVDEVRGGVQLTIAATFEVEGSEKPGCVAEILFRYYR